MSSELPEEIRATYAKIIDSILAVSDLNTISKKRIRKGLQAAVEYDITPQKDQISALIEDRFDVLIAKRDAKLSSANHDVLPLSPSTSPSKKMTNGHISAVKQRVVEPRQQVSPATTSDTNKEEEDSEALSDVVDVPVSSSKKKRKISPVEDDASLAARLQAEENSRARPTRGAAVRKSGPIRKKKKISSKSQSRVKDDDDSGLDSSSGKEKKRKVNRSGGFHKPMVLSTPLSEFLGEATLPRTEIVKRIWAYVRERELQDPNDKRQIRCDDALKTVFKQDRVHMFTMNKLLSGHVFAPDE